MNQFRSKTFAEMLFLVGVGLLAAAAVAGQSKTTKPETGKRKPLDGNTMTAKQFLSVVRYPQFINSWARLEGQIHHVSKGKRLKRKIEIRARLRPKEWRMQVILEGGERHLVRQIPADGLVGTTSIKQQDAGPGAATLQDFLIRPSDLTLSFLYWNFDKELEGDRLKTQKCRVLQLKHPGGEQVRIWVTVKYFFPLRVQWFREDNAKPFRQLDFKAGKAIKSSVNKDTEFYLIQEAVITGPDNGWKTRVKFKDTTGDEVTDQAPAPKDLFVHGVSAK